MTPHGRVARLASTMVFLVVACAAVVNTAAIASDAPYCFSEICPGDPPAALASVALTGLEGIAERSATQRKKTLEKLARALPHLAEGARRTLSGHMDEGGALLLDRSTLTLVLRIDVICEPVGPFTSVFKSESGHLTSVEFAPIATRGEIRLGIIRIARTFKVVAHSNAERVLIRDLSAKYGFAIDAAPQAQLAASNGTAITAYFVRQPDGFRMSFTRASLQDDATEFLSQAGCPRSDRIKID
jgi:hypothetical protein